MRKHLTFALAMIFSALAFMALVVAGADWWPDPWWLAGLAALLCPALGMAALALFIRWDDMRDETDPPAQPTPMDSASSTSRHEAVVWYEFH
ncbi:MAG: hypothetical protein SO053_01335 [Bifidobacterium animalis]|nr:hypothetical protein [Bifidobacterium animalis]MDY5039788.1 hypothetical protein [Bifidobacterium animalis]